MRIHPPVRVGSRALAISSVSPFAERRACCATLTTVSGTAPDATVESKTSSSRRLAAGVMSSSESSPRSTIRPGGSGPRSVATAVRTIARRIPAAMRPPRSATRSASRFLEAPLATMEGQRPPTRHRRRGTPPAARRPRSRAGRGCRCTARCGAGPRRLTCSWFRRAEPPRARMANLFTSSSRYSLATSAMKCVDPYRRDTWLVGSHVPGSRLSQHDASNGTRRRRATSMASKYSARSSGRWSTRTNGCRWSWQRVAMARIVAAGSRCGNRRIPDSWDGRRSAAAYRQSTWTGSSSPCSGFTSCSASSGSATPWCSTSS